MSMFAKHKPLNNTNSTQSRQGHLPQLLIALLIALGVSACGTPDSAQTEAQLAGPVVELATVSIKAPMRNRSGPSFKIREVTTDEAFLSLEESQLRRAEYTDGVDVPVMSELIYGKIRVALDDKADAAQLMVEMEPALKKGHWLMFYIDDKPAGAAIPVKASSLTLPTLALGEHLLRVDILDETLMVLQSSRPHIIYVEEMLNQPLAVN